LAFKFQLVMVGAGGDKVAPARPLHATDLEAAIAEAVKEFADERFHRTNQSHVDPSAAPRALILLENGREVYHLTEDEYVLNRMGEDDVL
jgi:hypothetical protein